METHLGSWRERELQFISEYSEVSSFYGGSYFCLVSPFWRNVCLLHANADSFIKGLLQHDMLDLVSSEGRHNHLSRFLAAAGSDETRMPTSAPASHSPHS